MERIFSWVDTHHDQLLDELFRLLRQKSISATREGIDKCAHMVKSMLETSGISARLFPTSGCPVVYGESIQGKHLPTVLIYGHYDVQPPEPLEEWESDPFTPVIRNDRIFCRGSSDNKGQIFCHIIAARLWNQLHGCLPMNVKYLFEGEEETGSPNLAAFVREHKDLLSCDLIVISDSHIHESGTPSLILGLKGMCSVELEVCSANRDLHSKYAAAIENPVWRLMEALQTLQQNHIITIPGFYDDVRTPSPLEISTCRKLPFDRGSMLRDFGIDHFISSRSGNDYYYNMMFEPVCNINGIFSGYTGQGHKAVLPHKAPARLDFRLVPDQDPQKIFELLCKHLSDKGFSDVRVTNTGMMNPSRTPIDNPYVAQLKLVVQQVWGVEPLLYPSIAGSGPTYVFDSELQKPNITIPFAAADQNNHGPNESLILEGLWNGIKIGAAMLQTLSGGLPSPI